MKEQYVAMFTSLSGSPTGKLLVRYLQEQQSQICDSRNWKEGDTKESALMASHYLQDVVDKILLNNQPSNHAEEDYE